MEGHLLMSGKERFRKSVFDGIVAGCMNLREASEHLGLSYRHTRRSHKRFSSRGCGGNRGKSASLRRKVLRRYREHYAEHGLGPTLAAEKLAQEGLEVDHETLRR